MKVIHIKTDLDFYNVIPAYAKSHGRYYGKQSKDGLLYHVILLCQEDIAELVALLHQDEVAA